MAGNLQPLVNNQRIVKNDGTPTDYFIRWAQQKQIDIGAGITAEQALEIIAKYLADHELQAGSGIQITPSGNISDSPTIAAEVQAILDQITNVHGSVLFRGAAGWEALAPGTAGQFLKTNGAGADPSWAAGGGGGGGGLALINTYNLAGVTYQNIVGDITSTYLTYLFEFIDVVPVSDSTHINAQVSTNGGTTWDTAGNYDTAMWQSNQASYASTVGGGGVTAWRVGWDVQNTVNNAFCVDFKVFNPLGATSQKASQFQQGSLSSDGNFYQRTGAGRWKNTAAYDAIRFFMANNSDVQTGNFGSGTLRVWGM